ncbi:hypothetical protein FA09DRAFT_250836 [Tilletiopsis washingtonensis]|uniref:Uncharacterized protein n=1 Tax=Tilletiopsis washingtonensis TaxID=58919 RepID=A0A316ZBS9_9BASI|nr:hypothetical protein FA09DRAFT_250836 [Tilletiopsis washingtonensis]PWN98766.1 hypothetical protein FA09DRAFT_250836 [Tilletiopsis washingtonensis]
MRSGVGDERRKPLFTAAVGRCVRDVKRAKRWSGAEGRVWQAGPGSARRDEARDRTKQGPRQRERRWWWLGRREEKHGRGEGSAVSGAASSNTAGRRTCTACRCSTSRAVRCSAGRPWRSSSRAAVTPCRFSACVMPKVHSDARTRSGRGSLGSCGLMGGAAGGAERSASALEEQAAKVKARRSPQACACLQRLSSTPRVQRAGRRPAEQPRGPRAKHEARRERQDTAEGARRRCSPALWAPPLAPSGTT